MEQRIEDLGEVLAGEGDEELLGERLEEAEGTQDDGAIGIDLLCLTYDLDGAKGERGIAHDLGSEATDEGVQAL